MKKSNYLYKKYIFFKFIIFFFLVIINNNQTLLFKLFKYKYNKLKPFPLNKTVKSHLLDFLIKKNYDLNDEFIQIEEVIEQIYKKNLTSIETISGGAGNIGNALIMINNLINICEKIKCKNIIAPYGLQNVIKNPIIDKDYNITIFPSSYDNQIKIDIRLNLTNTYYFRYKKKTNEMRLSIIREEILNNIPKYKANLEDLYINIRSGDIFLDKIHPDYSQPPLCFYKKIINESNYTNINIVSNGHENPVVDELLKIYPKIKYLHESVEGDISIIINAYNLIMPESTFTWTLIRLNNNLLNLYIYELISYNSRKIYDLITYDTRNINANMYIMEASHKYKKIMEKKWANSKIQLELMLKENCTNNKIRKIFSKKNYI